MWIFLREYMREHKQAIAYLIDGLTITVTGISTGAVSTVSVSGISVTWTTGTAYVAGDVTFWNVSSYICVSAHVAGSGNRPDNDLTGTYWNLLASGIHPAGGSLYSNGTFLIFGSNQYYTLLT